MKASTIVALKDQTERMNLLVDLSHEAGIVLDRTDEIATVDIVKLVAEDPLVFKVVDFELDIWRNPVRL
jgi:hypothetical protein